MSENHAQKIHDKFYTTLEKLKDELDATTRKHKYYQKTITEMADTLLDVQNVLNEQKKLNKMKLEIVGEIEKFNDMYQSIILKSKGITFYFTNYNDYYSCKCSYV